tara:strand:- start:453 stop:710 length:258 start_codon:yes stop_codon:yes gene_type:complete
MKEAKCGDIILDEGVDNWCSICYEPIIKEKYTCDLCADFRVEDGLWKEEEKEIRMYGFGDEMTEEEIKIEKEKEKEYEKNQNKWY